MFLVLSGPGEPAFANYDDTIDEKEESTETEDTDDPSVASRGGRQMWGPSPSALFAITAGNLGAAWSFAFLARWRPGSTISGVTAVASGVLLIGSAVETRGQCPFLKVPMIAGMAGLSIYNFAFANQRTANERMWINFVGWATPTIGGALEVAFGQCWQRNSDHSDQTEASRIEFGVGPRGITVTGRF